MLKDLRALCEKSIFQRVALASPMALSIALPRSSRADYSDPLHDEAAFLADGKSHPAKVMLRFFDSFEKAERTWRALEANATGAVYQRYDWCSNWFNVFGSVLGARPLIIVVFLNAKPVMLLPLYTVATLLGRRTALFMGDRHANIRLPLTVSEPDLRDQLRRNVDDGTVLKKICQGLRHNRLADYVSLGCMPDSFAGSDNVLASQLTCACADRAYFGTLQSDFEALYRERRGGVYMKKLRKKLRQLGEYGDITFEKADTPEAVEQALETFFEQKSARLHAIKIDNAFGDDNNCEFIRAIARKSAADGSGLLEFYSLKVGGSIVALFAGGRFNDAFSGALNSMTIDEPLVSKSPGDVVLHHLVEHLCAEGFTSFDLGLGESGYKKGWCEGVNLREVTFPVSRTGYALKLIESAEINLRAAILANPVTAKLARRAKYYVKQMISKT